MSTPNLIVIVGPPASGKAAVGTELARITGYRSFHNHLTGECVASLFGWGTPEYSDVSSELRKFLLSKALAKKGSAGVIFTFVWAFDDDADNQFMAEIVEIAKAGHNKICFVELLASQEARIAREGTPLRLSLKPSKHDVAKARALHAVVDRRHRMNSKGDFRYPEHHLIIDTEQQQPSEAARLIVSRFALQVKSEAKIES